MARRELLSQGRRVDSAQPRPGVSPSWRGGMRDNVRADSHQSHISTFQYRVVTAPPTVTRQPPPNDLLLKVMPPRVPRNQLVRPRLQCDHEPMRDHPLILVQAAAGFGKTSLLAQWRREHLAHGRVVAWLSAQPQDDVPRFVQGLGLALRAGSGRPTFIPTLLNT